MAEKKAAGDVAHEEARKPPETKEHVLKRKPVADNVVFVGKKPAMSYVMAVVTQFSGGNDTVDIKARGKSISRAVDVAEVARKRFLKDIDCSINIGTDSMMDEQRGSVNVSTISIRLSKKQASS